MAVWGGTSGSIPHFDLGVLLDDLGRSDEAIDAYRKALARDPALADAHDNLGLLCEAVGKKSNAITHLRTARKLYGRSTPAL